MVSAVSRIANDGTKLYILTNENAPQYKVITIDLADPKRERKDLIPEQKDAYLDDIIAVGQDHFVIVYKRNVSPRLLGTASGTRAKVPTGYRRNIPLLLRR